MLIDKNAILINSLAIKSIAKYLITIESEQCLEELSLFLNNHNDKTLVLGEGSNVVLPEYFDGIVIQTNLDAIEKLSDSEVKVGSSLNWNSFVNWSLDNNFYGLENLSLIPGSVGAAPIQNIGAYGVDLSQFVESVRFYDFLNNEIKEFNNNECKFSYRTSIFQNMNIIILSINFKFLPTTLNVEYASIQDYLLLNDIDKSTLTSKSLAKIIQSIRLSKLPDPSIIPNVGSFFKNPIVKRESIKTDHFAYDDLVVWDHSQDNVKVGAARLIQLIDDLIPSDLEVGLYGDHALVIINKGNASQDDVVNFSKIIQKQVLKTFNITLDIEPTIIYS
tara:strand:+ start:6551 stop:7549 length:999 start_codon:yes stop_codon:yes gene_type:complete